MLHFTQPLSGCLVTSAVSAAGQVTVTLFNPTGGTVNLASGTFETTTHSVGSK